MPDYKYNEEEIFQEILEYINSTYNQHYNTDGDLQCFDAWIALGDAEKTFRDTIISYLWRYGKKAGKNRKDLLKAFHYIMMMLYVDFYRNQEKDDRITLEEAVGIMEAGINERLICYNLDNNGTSLVPRCTMGKRCLCLEGRPAFGPLD